MPGMIVDPIRIKLGGCEFLTKVHVAPIEGRGLPCIAPQHAGRVASLVVRTLGDEEDPITFLGCKKYTHARLELIQPNTYRASPKFKNCTGNIGNQYTTRTCEIVTWSVPTAEDEFISVSRVSGESPGSTFPEGSHEVQYRATDNEGNYANCTIRFKVVVIRCPSLSAPYNGHVACSDINNVDSTCTYMCFTGHQLHNGSSSRTCRRTNNTASWTGTTPACSDFVIGASVSPTPAGTERFSPLTIVLISVMVIVVVVALI
ncbi:sushi repeat-containing protein SRPX-like [Diadema antillarum]|uniref:sushi repeat-containing protein SRPX-like n=1 Tax=Diadema antillarum TaxID=105358 RepID=UPI003A84D32F